MKVVTTKDENSIYDPSRKRVGLLYQDLQNQSHDSFVEAGDLTRELMSSLVEDINDAIKKDPFNGKEFYITVHEKKDLIMKRAIHRELRSSEKRPWPEDNTIVFRVFPKGNIIRFCWCLPHHTEMDNMLINAHLYNKEMVEDIKAYKKFDLIHFGFAKDSEGKWFHYRNHQDRPMR